MLAQIRKARQEESGFTLIELLMVIVILGVLAGVVVFAVGGISDRGQVSACKAEYKTIQVAEEAFYANSTGTATYTSTANLVPKYLGSAPKLYAVAAADASTTGYTIKPVGSTCAADPFA